MTARIICSVIDIVLLVAILAYFLARVGRQLSSISATLGKVTFGVRAVETQCAVIGPQADRINANLAGVVQDLQAAAASAERLAR